MFRLSSLLYVRDSVQGLQIPQKPLANAQAASRNGTQSYLGHSELLGPENGYQSREKVVLETSPENSISSSNNVTHPPRALTYPPLAVLEKNLGRNNTEPRKVREVAEQSKLSSLPHILSHSFVVSSQQTNASCHEGHHPSQNQHVLSINFQQRHANHDWDPRDLRERSNGASHTRDPVQERASLTSQVSPLSPQIENSKQKSSPIAPAGSKFQRLSTLQESNGNSYHLSETEQTEIAVVQKTRKPLKIDSQSPKASDGFSQRPIRKSSIRSFLTLRSSFTEDYTYSTTFLGRYRTPSTPELRVSESSGPLFQLQPLRRSSSLRSLKHLQPENKRELYIGVKNRRLFLPSNSGCLLKSLVVSYQVPRFEQRKMATMVPREVLSPPKPCTECALSHVVGLKNNTICKCLGSQRRNSSVVANIGSKDSASSQLSDGPQRYQMMAPATCFSFEAKPRLPQHLQITHEPNLERNCRGRIGKMKVINATQPTSEDDSYGLYNGVSRDLTDFNVGLGDPTEPETTDVSNEHVGDLTQLDGGGCDQECACWNPKYARAMGCTQRSCPAFADFDGDWNCLKRGLLGSPRNRRRKDDKVEVDQLPASGCAPTSHVVPGRIQNKVQHSVSFAKAIVERPINLYSATYSRSTSLSNPIIPLPLISPRLRGPSLSKVFEVNMMTLPMPPVDHSVPFAGHRSSNISREGCSARSVISLSSKPKGSWAKLKDTIKGCFGSS